MRKILVTSGGTKIPIDRVRHIANMSQGTFGSAIARCFLEESTDNHVTFMRAERSKSPFSATVDVRRQTVASALADVSAVVSLHEHCADRYTEVVYKTFDDYAHELESECRSEKPDVIVLAAAVSDYGTTPLKGKVRSKRAGMTIKLHKLPKLISEVRGWCPNAFLVGFKLLVDSTYEKLRDEAARSVAKNGCDLVVANDLSDIQRGDHRVMLVSVDDNGYVNAHQMADSQAVGGLARWVCRCIGNAAYDKQRRLALAARRAR